MENQSKKQLEMKWTLGSHNGLRRVSLGAWIIEFGGRYWGPPFGSVGCVLGGLSFMVGNEGRTMSLGHAGRPQASIKEWKREWKLLGFRL